MPERLSISGVTARDIMSHPVHTVSVKDSLRDIASLFIDRAIGAAAVIDERGKPVGVITKTDLVRAHKPRNGGRTLPPGGDGAEVAATDDILGSAGPLPDGDRSLAREWMTPVIFVVPPDTAVKAVAKWMVKYGVHHMFVRGRNSEEIVGMVSSFDILRHLASDTRERPADFGGPS